MQGLKVLPPPAASQQSFFFLQGRQETKLCDHPLATLAQVLLWCRALITGFMLCSQCLKCLNIFFPIPLGEEGAEKQKGLKGNLLQVLVKPWAESISPELQVHILLNMETLLLSDPCAAGGDLQKD